MFDYLFNIGVNPKQSELVHLNKVCAQLLFTYVEEYNIIIIK